MNNQKNKENKDFGCAESRELFSLYLDDMLSDDQVELLQNHLAICDKCNAEFNEIKKIKELLSEVPSIALPEDFDEGLHKALLAESRRTLTIAEPNKSRKSLPWRRLAAVCAIFVVSIFTISMYNNNEVIDGFDELKETGKTNEMSFVAALPESKGLKTSMVYESALADMDIADNEAAPEEEPNQKSLAFQEPEVVEEASVEDSAADMTDDASAPNYNLANDITSSDKDCVSFTKSPKAMGTYTLEFYEELLAQELLDTEYKILQFSQDTEGTWEFEVLTKTLDEAGNTITKTIYYKGLDGNLLCQQKE